jgi:hypothetical protein
MMADQSVAPAGNATRSRSELVAALPTVRRLIDQLHKAIQPAVVAEHAAPEAQAMFQAATTITWLANALDAPDRASRIARLTEVGYRADYVNRSAQQRLAELQTMDELAADEQDRRVGSVDTTAIVDRAQFAVVLPNGTSTTITVTITDGQVTWEASTVDLGPVDGPVQLAVTTMLTQLGETLTKALPASAFDEQW